MFYQHHIGTGAWIFTLLATVAILGLIAAFVVWLVSDLRDRPRRRRPLDASAAEILDRRLASGELSVEEYRRVRDALRPSPTEQPPGGGGGPAAAPS